MGAQLPYIAIFIIVCQAGSALLAAWLHPSRFPGRRTMLPAAAAAASGLLAGLWPQMPVAALSAAGIWAAAAGFLIYGRRAVPAALLGWTLCLLAALLTRAIAGIGAQPSAALYSILVTLVWIAMDGLLLGAAAGLIRSVQHAPLDGPRLLLMLSCCLEFAAVGFFACRILGHRSPQITAALIVAFMLGISYIVLIFMFRHVLRNDARWQRRRSLIQAELKVQEEQFASTAGMLASARRMRHDFSNHAEVARGLAQSGRSEAALRYLDRVRRAWQQENADGTELLNFGRLTGELAAACAQRGITFRIAGAVPREAGFEGNAALLLLRDVAGWAVDQLQTDEKGTISLHLQGKGSFECLIGPCRPPGPEDLAALASLCGGRRTEMEAAGRHIRLRVGSPPS